MPAIICYVYDRTDRREIQMRVRFSQRVAIPLYEWPHPPKTLLLQCPGFTAELKYTTAALNFAVYYIGSADFDMLINLIRHYCNYEPCRLPCILTAPATT